MHVNTIIIIISMPLGIANFMVFTVEFYSRLASINFTSIIYCNLSYLLQEVSYAKIHKNSYKS